MLKNIFYGVHYTCGFLIFFHILLYPNPKYNLWIIIQITYKCLIYTSMANTTKKAKLNLSITRCMAMICFSLLKSNIKN